MTEGRPARFDARAAPFLTALVVFAVYVFSLDRDVGFWDTGELQTVPYILGLMHPTGYPTEILLGWIFTHVFAFGEPAMRMNLFCMLCVVVAAGCCCALAQLLGARPAIAGSAALCFAFTPVVWSHATHADVTDPALALCALALLCAALAVARESTRWVYGAALCVALALGTHGMVVWFLPLPALLVAFSGKRALFRALPGAGAIIVVVTAALYAYLPLRSQAVSDAQIDPGWSIGLGPADPFWDMGHPSVLSGFLDIVTGRTVDAPGSLAAGFAVGNYPRDIAFAFGQLHANYAFMALVVVLLLAAYGAGRSWRRWLYVLPAILVTPFAATFANESDVSRYYTFPLLCVWVLVVNGFTRVSDLVLPRRRESALFAASLTLLAFSGQEAYAGRGTFEQRNDRLGSTYIREVLGATGSRSILIANWVYATPLAYAAYVRKSTGDRILVASPAENVASHLSVWLEQRPVYAIAETPPNVPVKVTLIRALGVNPGPHDPKVYRLGDGAP